MGQFKPMVKMVTTEPSVELKLKTGGAVEKKMQMGGALAARPAAGLPARGGMMPAAAPGKPSMAARRRAMMAGPTGAAPAAPVGMAGRMMKEGGETKKEHAAEMKQMMGTEAKLKKHADMPASKAHKGLKTGGVVDGQGGYKSGGIIKSKAGKTTKMDTAKPDHSPAKTGVVKMGNKAGYATGGVAKANGGGYASGGPAFMFGGKQRTRPLFRQSTQQVTPISRPAEQVEIPPPPIIKTKVPSVPTTGGSPESQPKIPPPKPPSVPSPGGMKKGGAAKKAYATGGLVDTGRPVAMPQGNKRPPSPVSINQLSGTYKKGGAVMMNKGGDVPPEGVKDVIQTARNERAYRAWEKGEAESAKKASEGLGSMLSAIPRKLREVFSPEKAASAPGSVTKTEKSVTVTPKKRGGAVTC